MQIDHETHIATLENTVAAQAVTITRLDALCQHLTNTLKLLEETSDELPAAD